MGGVSISYRWIRAETGLSRPLVNAGLYRLWRNGSVFRTKDVIREHVNKFRGWYGKTQYLLQFTGTSWG